MSHDEIHHDSLLSSISNISVKIDHTEIDDPGFFIHGLQKSLNHPQVDCEINIDVIQDDEDVDPASLVKQIYYQYRGKDLKSEQQDFIEPWMCRNHDQGVSEEDPSEQSYLQSVKQEEKQEHLQAQALRQKELKIEAVRKYSSVEEKRLKNQTKNIPKNYGKAIITFIQKYETKVREILAHHKIDYDEFAQELKQRKRVINTIADLRNMWLDYGHAKSMRVLSNLFLRKYALSYIFNSRICNYTSHIKYRYRLSEAIKEPGLFKHIKDY